MNEETKIYLAFCWYEPGEWLKLKKAAVDAEKQDDSFEEWKANANKAIAEIQSTGQSVVKIAMKSEEFFAWCKDKNYENNSKARSEFAAEKLEERRRET